MTLHRLIFYLLICQKVTLLERARNVQQQLLRDLEHPYVSGVYVERALAKKWNRQMGIMMPFVFTSGLGLEKIMGQQQWVAIWGNCIWIISNSSSLA